MSHLEQLSCFTSLLAMSLICRIYSVAFAFVVVLNQYVLILNNLHLLSIFQIYRLRPKTLMS